MVKKSAQTSEPGIGLIGAGDEAMRIADGYVRAGNRISAIWDPDKEAAAQLAETTGAVAAETLPQLLDNPSIQAVEVTSPIERRADDAVAALKAGKWVSVRSPVACSTEEAAGLEQTVKSLGGKFRCLNPIHHHAPHALARKLAVNNEIGYLNGIRIKASCADVDRIDPAGFAEPLDRICLAAWIMGPVEEVETLRNNSSSITIVKFTKKHCFGNFEAVMTPELRVPFAQRDWEESVEISGTTGLIWVHGFWGAIADRPPVMMRRYKRLISFGANIMVNPEAAYARAARMLVKTLRYEIKASPDINYALGEVKLMEAANRSAREGGRVRVQ